MEWRTRARRPERKTARGGAARARQGGKKRWRIWREKAQEGERASIASLTLAIDILFSEKSAFRRRGRLNDRLRRRKLEIFLLDEERD